MNDTTDNANVCRQCGAAVEAEQTQCWLCQTLAETHARSPERVDSGPVNAWSFSITTLFFTVTIVSACLALALHMPVLGVLLAALLLLALTCTTVYGQKQRRAHRKWTTGSQVGTFARVIQLAMLTVLFAIVGSFAALFLLIILLATVRLATGTLR